MFKSKRDLKVNRVRLRWLNRSAFHNWFLDCVMDAEIILSLRGTGRNAYVTLFLPLRDPSLSIISVQF